MTPSPALVEVIRKAIIKVRSDEAGGCFNPEETVSPDDCADGICWCAKYGLADAEAVLAAVRPMILEEAATEAHEFLLRCEEPAYADGLRESILALALSDAPPLAFTVWKNGGYKLWRHIDAHYAENDPDWLVTIPIRALASPEKAAPGDHTLAPSRDGEATRKDASTGAAPLPSHHVTAVTPSSTAVENGSVAKHPLAIETGAGFTDANGRSVKGGDRIEFRDGRRGTMDEAMQDGEAFVTWDDGTHETINWKHCCKISETGQ